MHTCNFWIVNLKNRKIKRKTSLKSLQRCLPAVFSILTLSKTILNQRRELQIKIWCEWTLFYVRVNRKLDTYRVGGNQSSNTSELWSKRCFDYFFLSESFWVWLYLEDRWHHPCGCWPIFIPSDIIAAIDDPYHSMSGNDKISEVQAEIDKTKDTVQQGIGLLRRRIGVVPTLVSFPHSPWEFADIHCSNFSMFSSCHRSRRQIGWTRW